MDTVVVKVGGSLALFPDKLRSLCIKLVELSRCYSLVVVPGGGEFADIVRNLDMRLHLSRKATHRMAILAMDQYGLLLVDLMPDSIPVDNLENVQGVLDSGRLSVFLPAAALSFEDELESSWDVTSDSIAIYIAEKLHAPKVILVTDVDGIYTCDPKKFSDAKLISQLSASRLLEMDQRTSVDKFLPKLLLQLKIDCFVVNGLHPQRVEAIIKEKETVSTLITRSP